MIKELWFQNLKPVLKVLIQKIRKEESEVAGFLVF